MLYVAILQIFDDVREASDTAMIIDTAAHCSYRH